MDGVRITKCSDQRRVDGVVRKPIGDIHFSINIFFYDFDTLKQVLLLI